MRQSRAILQCLLLTAVVTPCFADKPLTMDSLKDQAALDAATPEGGAYLKEFFTNPWMLALDSAEEQCQAAELRSPPHDEFVIALWIGDNGYPADVLVSPDDEGLRCLADRLKAIGFIKPPHDGFAIYMPFKRAEVVGNVVSAADRP